MVRYSWQNWGNSTSSQFFHSRYVVTFLESARFQSASLCFVVAGALLCLTGCGLSQKPANSTNSSGTAAQRLTLDPNSTQNATSGRYGMATVPLIPGQVAGTESPSNAGANFQGCWYTHKGHRFQAVDVSVTNPGSYPFYAELYYGTTCDPNTQADEFDQEFDFGGFNYIVWFTAFSDRDDMSALWHVGTDTSKCVNYKVAPDCP
jgi:hypothetical protein